MIDIPLGNWVKDYDGYTLMKFTSMYQYQQSFLDGKLFFNTSDFFARCDDVGRGDANEGNYLVVKETEGSKTSLRYEVINGKLFLIEEDFTNNPLDYKKSNVFSYSPAKNRNRKVISFYTMYVNIMKGMISPFVDNMAEQFGEYGILILDRQEFFSRVCKALKHTEGLKEARMGFVEYDAINPGVNHWHPFKKDKNRYEYQNEFRITFVNDNDKVFSLDLRKSLRDIAVPIQAKDLTEIHFEDGKLLYPIYREMS